MKKYLFILGIFLCTAAASCDIRLGDRTPATPTVPVQPDIVINLFTAEPGTTVIAGTTVTLRWSTSNSASCRLDPNVGDVPVSGFTQLTLVNSATFTLTCTNKLKSASRILSVVVVVK